MALFEKGDSVIKINTNEKGIISSIGACIRGRQLYQVFFNGEERSELEWDLLLDCNIENPFECCRHNMYGTYTDFLRISTNFKINNTSNSTISSLKASKTLFKAYQYKPLLKFLNSDIRKLLVADEVGLGKTIEAGHIMLELKARQKLRNVLIICPKSLKEKWQNELQEKFGLAFTVMDQKAELIKSLKSSRYTKAIITYEAIRSEEDSKEHKEQNTILQYIEENAPRFSFVLCDEAHKMRNSNTQTYKGAKKIMDIADAAMFLTATPIMISEKNLYNLLHLLDEQKYYNYDIFEQGLNENKPFIKALNKLSLKISLPKIAEELEESEIKAKTGEWFCVKDYFKDFPIYQRIIQSMREGKDSDILRAKLQQDIVSMSPMNNIFSRTRKKEVTTDWSQCTRKPHRRIIELHKEEQRLYDEIIDYYIDDEGNLQKQEHILSLIHAKRQIASSIYGYLNKDEDLKNGIDIYADQADAKFEDLLKIIKAVFRNKKKIIIFAIFKKTLYYLQIRLKKAGYNAAMIHGDITNRQEILYEFQYNPDIQILLSSEVGSEGLDMQFCDSMVNYDLPWNPMVVEQRIGRIDRFGQESEIVNIYNLIIKNSIQEDIYDRLLERIGIFRESIGELETILDAESESSSNEKVSIHQLYSRIEKDLYCNKLTKEERQEKLSNIAMAICREQEELRQIGESLENTFTNDEYFRQEILRILKNNAYVTEIELKHYIEKLIEEHLTTCSLTEESEGVYKFCIPQTNKRALISFLEENRPGDMEEGDRLFSSFINSIRDVSQIRMTFNQDIAYKNKKIIYINLYHPIIQATLRYNNKQNNLQNKAFRLLIRKEFLNAKLSKGQYFLVLYQYDISKTIAGINKNSSILKPILYDIKKCSIINDEELTNDFWRGAQTQGEYDDLDICEIDADVLDNMECDIVDYVSKYRSEYENELKIKEQNAQLMAKKQTENYWDYRIFKEEQKIQQKEEELEFAKYNKDTKRIKDIEKTLRLWRGGANKLREEKESHLAEIMQDSNLQVKTKPLFINLITII